MYFNKFNKNNGILLDQNGKMTGYYASKDYPEKLRLIKYYNKETDNDLEHIST